MNEVPVCSCLPGYRGSPLTGCHHECKNVNALIIFF